jgi:hypothetical protein
MSLQSEQTLTWVRHELTLIKGHDPAVCFRYNLLKNMETQALIKRYKALFEEAADRTEEFGDFGLAAEFAKKFLKTDIGGRHLYRKPKEK